MERPEGDRVSVTQGRCVVGGIADATSAATDPQRPRPWRIEPGGSNQATLADLEPLVTLYVEEVDLGTEELSIRFDDGRRLIVATAPADRDSEGWWLSLAAG
jgi:hypothetical protein